MEIDGTFGDEVLPNTLFRWTSPVFHRLIANLEPHSIVLCNADASSLTLLMIPSRSSSANKAGTIPVVNILLINSKNPIEAKEKHVDDELREKALEPSSATC